MKDAQTRIFLCILSVVGVLVRGKEIKCSKGARYEAANKGDAETVYGFRQTV